MKKKSIGVSIILTLLTCGIYGIYWFICLTNDMNTIANDDYQTSGATAFLLSLITCGIYGIYWAYKMGQKMDKFNNSDNAILFILLQIVGLGIVNYCIMQNEINKQC